MLKGFYYLSGSSMFFIREERTKKNVLSFYVPKGGGIFVTKENY